MKTKIIDICDHVINYFLFLLVMAAAAAIMIFIAWIAYQIFLVFGLIGTPIFIFLLAVVIKHSLK